MTGDKKKLKLYHADLKQSFHSWMTSRCEIEDLCLKPLAMINPSKIRDPREDWVTAMGYVKFQVEKKKVKHWLRKQPMGCS